MHNPAQLILGAVTLGQALLCLTLLAARTKKPTDIPLMALFAAAAIVVAAPIVGAALPAASPFLFAVSLPAWLALAPALSLYVEALTAETPWRLQRRHVWSVGPAGLAGLVLVLVALLPAAERDAMLVRGQMVDTPFALAAAMFIFAVILVGLAQSVVTAGSMLLRLSLYRRRLKDLFANNDQRELWWLSGLVAFVGCVWLATVASLTADTLFDVVLMPIPVLQALALAALWALAWCGLRQAPGFEARYAEAQVDIPAPARKYSKSALTAEQAQRIAGRIDAAMTKDRLCLDPSLSLQKLAAHLGIAANTVSQTLNEHVGETFFAYVNRHRVEAAKPLLAAAERNVLEIALEVGFNSKSAFYKAFRQATGVTPAQFRQLK